jgi:hypothetical protein
MIIAPCFCPSLTKSGFSRQISIKAPNIKFHGYLSGGNPSDVSKRMDRQTDGEEAANSHV